ncbi:MAG: aldolase/citrate lyase family protein [Caldilineaceae bacterium]
MYPNPLKQKLQAGELVLGTALPVFASNFAVLASQTGVDFLWIDLEHSPYGTESLDAIPVLVRNQGVAPMLRVAWNDPHLIKKAFDVGAVAVMVPQVNTAEEAARAVQYAFYPPKGQRGVSPSWPNIAGEDWGNVIRTANDETVLILQIESVEAYENLEAIAQVPGIDVLLVGPMDLSASVGKITDMQCEEVQGMMQEIPKRLAGSGIVVGTTLTDISEIQQKYRWGYRFLNIGSPLGYGISALKEHVNTMRTNPSGA